MCFLGDAHAGASSRVQLGAPPRSSFAAGVGLFAERLNAGALTFTRRVGRLWFQGCRADCKLGVLVKDVLLGRRPCGRLQPSTTRRSAAQPSAGLWGRDCLGRRVDVP